MHTGLSMFSENTSTNGNEKKKRAPKPPNFQKDVLIPIIYAN